MIISGDILAELRTRVEAIFQQIYETHPAQWPQFTSELTGAEETNKFDWFGATPMIREIRGVVDVGKVSHSDYTITVGEQGVALQIGTKMLYHNRLGQVGLLTSQVFSRTAIYEDKLCAEKLSSGFATTNGAAFDSKAFYAANHSYGDSGTHDNVDNSALSYVDMTAYNLAWLTINTAPDEHAVPMAHIPTHLMVHPANRETVLKMLKATQIDGTTNVMAGDVTPLISPYLSTSTEWHLMACGGPLKPIIKLVEIPYSLNAIDSAEWVAKYGYAEYIIRGAQAVGYTDPRLAYGSTGA